MFWKKTAIGLIVISLFANTAAAQKVGTNVSTSSFVPAPPPSKVTANITVKYDSNFPAAARTAFEYAKNIWARSISSPVPIIINAHWKPLNSRYYGEAKPAAVAKNQSSAMKPNTWYPIALANKLVGRDLSPSNADIEATFNSGYAWYFGTDGKTPATKYDFVTAVLHELGHGLGILGTMQVSTAVVGEAKTSSGNFRAFRYIVNTEKTGKMENLSVLPGALQSYARSINNKGEVVGFSSFTNSRTKAFIWDSSASLRVLSSFVSDSALGINSKTQVVGSFRMGDFNSFAFLWSNGKSTPLGTPAIKSSFAQDINDDGTVVGYTNQFPGTGTFRAFKWTSGSGSGSGFTDLGTLPGGTSSKAWEVNDYFDKNGNGKKDTNEFPLVVGESNGHIFLRDLGTSNNRDLGLGVAYGVNNNGEVVGKANSAGTQSAFIWKEGKIFDLNRFIANKCPASGSTWNLQVANDISQSGKIVGKGINCEGQTRAFLLTPTQIGNYDILDLGTLGGTESSAWGVNDSGGPGMWGYSPSSKSPLYPYVYDNFIVNSSSQNLINTALFPNSSDKLADQLISNKIAWSGSKAKLANGGTVPMLYAPSDWKEISSIVHLDENKYPRGNVNSLMTPVLDEGEAIHNPGPVTLGILKDMGW